MLGLDDAIRTASENNTNADKQAERFELDYTENPDLERDDGEHEPFPDGWRCVVWKAAGGYGSGNGNPYRERIWLSPACLAPEKT